VDRRRASCGVPHARGVADDVCACLPVCVAQGIRALSFCENEVVIISNADVLLKMLVFEWNVEVERPFPSTVPDTEISLHFHEATQFYVTRCGTAHVSMSYAPCNQTSHPPLSLRLVPPNAAWPASSVDAETGERVLRVWNAELELHAVGRNEDGTKVPGMCAAISWRPDSGLIAAAQNLRDEELRVIFFERNGLRHREFTIKGVDPKVYDVADLDWNPAGDILAVRLRSCDDPPRSRLQLWSRSNYSWSMKREFVGNTARRINRVAWDPDTFMRMSVVMSSNESRLDIPHALLRTLEVAWDYTASLTPDTTVGMVDGGTSVLFVPCCRSTHPCPGLTSFLFHCVPPTHSYPHSVTETHPPENCHCSTPDGVLHLGPSTSGVRGDV